MQSLGGLRKFSAPVPQVTDEKGTIGQAAIPHQDVFKSGTNYSIFIIQWYSSGYLYSDRSLASCWKDWLSVMRKKAERRESMFFLPRGNVFEEPGDV